MGGFAVEAGFDGLLAPPDPTPVRRTGGGGMLEVLMPVLLALNGRAGGAGFCAASSCSCCCARNLSVDTGEPSPLCEAETALVGDEVGLP